MKLFLIVFGIIFLGACFYTAGEPLLLIRRTPPKFGVDVIDHHPKNPAYFEHVNTLKYKETEAAEMLKASLDLEAYADLLCYNIVYHTDSETCPYGVVRD